MAIIENATEEHFALRTVDGPFDGDRIVTLDQIGSWPPPEILTTPGQWDGEYKLVSYSDLPAQDPNSHVIRGVEYKWVTKQ